MGSNGILRRVLPFFATFAVGIFIASFFVSVTPNFGRGEWSKRKAECKRLKFENKKLREENLRLRQQIETNEFGEMPAVAHEMPRGIGPEVPVALPPPPPPVAVRRTN